MIVDGKDGNVVVAKVQVLAVAVSRVKIRSVPMTWVIVVEPMVV